MTVKIQAHFDGKAFIPEEAVNLPAGTRVTVEAELPAGTARSESKEVRRAALLRLSSRESTSTSIPTEALRREHMYGDDQ